MTDPSAGYGARAVTRRPRRAAAPRARPYRDNRQPAADGDRKMGFGGTLIGVVTLKDLAPAKWRSVSPAPLIACGVRQRITGGVGMVVAPQAALPRALAVPEARDGGS